MERNIWMIPIVRKLGYQYHPLQLQYITSRTDSNLWKDEWRSKAISIQVYGFRELTTIQINFPLL